MISVTLPEVKLEVSNVNDFLPIEDSVLPFDLLHIGRLTRFVVYQVVTLIPPAPSMSSDDFAADYKKRRSPKKPTITAVEYQSRKPLDRYRPQPQSWMSFQDALKVAISVPDGKVAFAYSEEAFIPEEVWEEVSVPMELVQYSLEGDLILPLAPGDKKPLVQWIYGERPATSDLEQIKKWFINFPGCNWGSRMGRASNKVGVDQDSFAGHQYIESNGGLPVTLTTKSGNPDPHRKHYQLRVPAGKIVKSSSSKKPLAPGIDIKGENGFLVIPPSLHKSGNKYRVEVQAPVADMTQWLMDALEAAGLIVDATSPEREKPKGTPVYSELNEDDREHGLTIVRNQIMATLKKCDEFTIEDAPFNDELNILAGTCGNMKAGGVADEEFLKAMVEEYCLEYVEDNRSGFEATWRSGFTFGCESPWNPNPTQEQLREIFGNYPLPSGCIPPEVWEQQQKAQIQFIADKLAAERSVAQETEGAKRDSSWQLPEGLLGDVAHFIYQCAYKPNQEVALAGAVAFLAGIAGRQYNTSTCTGLNQYVILLAETSRGKEGAARGIGKLRRAIKDIDLTFDIDQFIGPSAIASSPALKKRLANVSECFYAQMGEIGKTLQKMTARNANPNDTELMGTLMDLYMKSGKYDSLKESAYSTKGENIPEIHSPCVSIIGDSTPGDFYKAMTLSDFASGLIPRFTIIEHVGKIPPSNNRKVIPSPALVKRLMKFIGTVIKLQVGHRVIEVEMSPEAQAFTDKFERDYERKIEQHPGPLAQLWSRSHLRLLRLSSLVAVGAVDWSNDTADFTNFIPTVTLPMVEWAAGLIIRSNEIVEQRVEAGGIGQSGEADEQRKAIEGCISRFVKSTYKPTWGSYGISQEMHKNGQMTLRYLRNATVSKKCFVNQDYGRASTGILRNLEDAEHIKSFYLANSSNGTKSQIVQVLTTEGLYEGD
jgi:Bifunctional DNA primase/polymerase, N-terminal